MAQIVRLLCGREPSQETFVSIEGIPVVLADVRRVLPQLEQDLRKKWPVKHVDIESRIPRRKNPYDLLEIVAGACIGLVITFTVSGAKAAGAKTGETVGQEISVYVRHWIRGLGKRNKSRRKKK